MATAEAAAAVVLVVVVAGAVADGAGGINRPALGVHVFSGNDFTVAGGMVNQSVR